MIISLQASTPIFMDSGLSSFCLINVSMGGGKFCRAGPKNISLTSLSIEPSPWGGGGKINERVDDPHKERVRERTPEESAFLTEEEPPPCTFAVNSDSSKRNCSDLHIMATNHQISTFLSYDTCLPPGEMRSSPFLGGFCTWQGGLKWKASYWLKAPEYGSAMFMRSDLALPLSYSSCLHC